LRKTMLGRGSSSNRELSGSGHRVKTETESEYEHIGGEDDVFLIKGNTGSCKLHRRILRDTLEELKQYSRVRVNQLDVEREELLNSVVEAMRLLYGSPALYDLVLC